MYGDSNLVIQYMTGVFRPKNSRLQRLVLEIKKVVKYIPLNVFWLQVPREKNQVPDFLANKAREYQGDVLLS